MNKKTKNLLNFFTIIIIVICFFGIWKSVYAQEIGAPTLNNATVLSCTKTSNISYIYSGQCENDLNWYWSNCTGGSFYNPKPSIENKWRCQEIYRDAVVKYKNCCKDCIYFNVRFNWNSGCYATDDEPYYYENGWQPLAPGIKVNTSGCNVPNNTEDRDFTISNNSTSVIIGSVRYGCWPGCPVNSWSNQKVVSCIPSIPSPGPFTINSCNTRCDEQNKINRVSWTSSSNASYYKVYYWENGNPYYLATTYNTYVDIVESRYWGTQYYTVVAFNDSGSRNGDGMSQCNNLNCQWWNGYHDGQSGTQTSTSSCNANGWAVDTNAKSTSIYVDVYVDKTAQQAYNEGYVNSGSYSKRVLANLERSDVCNDRPDYSTGGSCRHGFNLNLANTFPNIFSDNNSHTVYVYPIKATGDGDGSILNYSPKTIRCQIAPTAFDISLSSDNCASATCLRNLRASWTASTNAVGYSLQIRRTDENNLIKNYNYTVYDTTNNTYSVDGISIRISGRSVEVSDNGNSKYEFRVTAYNSNGTARNASTYPLSVNRCAPVIKSFSPSQCINNSPAHKLTWDYCFADRSTLTRDDCNYVLGYYTLSYGYTFDSAKTQSQINSAVTNALSGADYKDLSVGATSLSVKLRRVTEEDRIKNALRSLGHYKETISRSGLPLSWNLTCGTGGKALLQYSTSKEYIDNIEDSNIYHNYQLIVIRNIDGRSVTSAPIQAPPCLEGRGLTVEHDPNISNNPPPGFADLFGPLFKELVP